MARKNLVSGMILLAGALMWLAASLESDNRAGVVPSPRTATTR